jgi:hypothetical protein
MRHVMLITTALATLASPFAFAVSVCGDGITPAMIQYESDVVAQLAQAPDDESIFAAAVISDYFSSPSSLISHDVLLWRAQIAAPRDSHIWWASALVRADTIPTTDAAIAHLLDIAPENVAVWLLELDRAQKARDTVAEQAAIAHAAQAQYFDDYTAAINSRTLHAVEHTQVSATVPEKFYESGISANQKMPRRFASNFGGSVYLPYEALESACALERLATSTQLQLRAQCLAISKLLVEHSTTWLAMGWGLSLQQNLAESPNDIAEVECQRRNLIWLETSSFRRSHDADREYEWILEGRTEQESARIMLKEAGLPLEAPIE